MSERGPLGVSPRRYGRAWLAFGRTVERVAVFLGGRTFYRTVYLGPGRFRVREERVEVEGLPAGLEGFRILQLTDLHAGRFLGRGDLAHVVEAVNRAEPDVVALTGDFVVSRWQEVVEIAADLGRLRGRHGVFAVFGNHDYRGRDEHRIADCLGEEGIRFLRNRSVRIDTGDGVLALVGLEDLEEGKRIDERAARADLEPDDVEVVLCHNPLGAPLLARDRCAAVLSGHTHGNQIDLPGFRRFGPPHPGGRVQHGSTVAITSSGLGAIGLPLRIGAPAEVVSLTLVSPAAS